MCYDWSKDMNKIKNLSYDYIMNETMEVEGIFLPLAWVTYLVTIFFAKYVLFCLLLRFSSSF